MKASAPAIGLAIPTATAVLSDNFGTTGLAVERARAQQPYAPLPPEGRHPFADSPAAAGYPPGQPTPGQVEPHTNELKVYYK